MRWAECNCKNKYTRRGSERKTTVHTALIPQHKKKNCAPYNFSNLNPWDLKPKIMCGSSLLLLVLLFVVGGKVFFFLYKIVVCVFLIVFTAFGSYSSYILFTVVVMHFSSNGKKKQPNSKTTEMNIKRFNC